MTCPPLLEFADYGGSWDAYEKALYAVFKRDILDHDLRYDGFPISARRIPEYQRRWASYWHLISEGYIEDDRTPDLRRCERLPWIRWIIENAPDHPDIDVWIQNRNGKKTVALWYDEQYIIFLEKRRDYLLLKTAFFEDKTHRVEKFRKEAGQVAYRGGKRLKPPHRMRRLRKLFLHMADELCDI